MSKHILVVEDELYARISLSIILKSRGYAVTLAQNGEEALALIKECLSGQKVDLVLTDMVMPRMSGIEFLEALRKQRLDTPVVAITGYGNKEMVVQLMRSGCKDYLEKPFDPDQVINCIEKVFDEIAADVIKAENEAETAQEEQFRLSQELEAYKTRFADLRRQVISAVDIYQDIIHLDYRHCGAAIALRNHPLSELGGDYIGIEGNGRRCDIFIADVAGHDIGSSYQTILLKAFFDENYRQGNNGKTLLQLINKQLVENSKSERMITGLFLSLDLNQMRGEVISAAHPALIHFQQQPQQFRFLTSNDRPLGIYENIELNPLQFSFVPGDRFFLYTDGLISAKHIDSNSGMIIPLTSSRLLDLLANHRAEPLEAAIHSIMKQILTHCNHKPDDDMMLVGVQIP